MYEVKRDGEMFTSEVMSLQDLLDFASNIVDREIDDEEDARNIILKDGYYAVYKFDEEDF